MVSSCVVAGAEHLYDAYPRTGRQRQQQQQPLFDAEEGAPKWSQDE
jgi:hypothetical protein